MHRSAFIFKLIILEYFAMMTILMISEEEYTDMITASDESMPFATSASYYHSLLFWFVFTLTAFLSSFLVILNIR